MVHKALHNKKPGGKKTVSFEKSVSFSDDPPPPPASILAKKVREQKKRTNRREYEGERATELRDHKRAKLGTTLKRNSRQKNVCKMAIITENQRS